MANRASLPTSTSCYPPREPVQGGCLHRCARSGARLGEHRRRIDLEGSRAWIAPPEYVILRKLEYLRDGAQDKHVRDIHFILGATEVDRMFLENEVARLGVRAQWARCEAQKR